MNSNKNILERIARLRGDLRLSDFCQKCGIPYSTLKGYFDGRRSPGNIDIISKIAESNNVSVEWIYTGKLPEIITIDDTVLEKFYELDNEVIDIEKNTNNKEQKNVTIYPVVRAYDDMEYHIIFFCIHCETWHSHGRGLIGGKFITGRGKNGGAGGHRTTHCIAQNSPFRKNGIILDVVAKTKDINDIDEREGNAKMCPKCGSYFSCAFNACGCGFVNTKNDIKHKKLADLYQVLGPRGNSGYFPLELTKESSKKRIYKNKKQHFVTAADSAAHYHHGRRSGPAEADLVEVTYHEEGYGMAGDGIINHNTAPTVMQFERDFLVGRFGISRFEHIHIINAVGDSMQDNIQPGDLLFVNPGDTDIVTGAIYALVIGDKTLVKRAEYNPVSGELTLISDNKKYKPLTVSGQDLDKVRVVGRVIGNLRKL